MEHYTNLENTKEYQLAKEWETAVNSYNFDPKKICGGNPVNAPDASTEPLSTHQGVHQSNG